MFADQYPYEASGTGIVGALIPRWAEAGGRDAMLKRIHGDRATRLRAAIADNIARRGGADKLVISDYAPNQALRRAVAGRRSPTATIEAASRSRRC